MSVFHPLLSSLILLSSTWLKTAGFFFASGLRASDKSLSCNGVIVPRSCLCPLTAQRAMLHQLNAQSDCNVIVCKVLYPFYSNVVDMPCLLALIC